jgi:hypothetical protein
MEVIMKSVNAERGAVGCIDLLGRIRKSSDGSTLLDFRTKPDTGDKLRYVKSYRGVLARLVDAAKREGVRFRVNDFSGDDIVSVNNDIVVIRGDALRVFDGVFERQERRHRSGKFHKRKNRSNETEMSRRERERACLRVGGLNSCEAG